MASNLAARLQGSRDIAERLSHGQPVPLFLAKGAVS
jgi:hypothetical protein